MGTIAGDLLAMTVAWHGATGSDCDAELEILKTTVDLRNSSVSQHSKLQTLLAADQEPQKPKAFLCEAQETARIGPGDSEAETDANEPH